MFTDSTVFKNDIKYISGLIGEGLKGKTVAVTGVCGMIGTVLAYALLDADCTIIGIDISEERAHDRFDKYIKDGRFRFFAQDITKPFEIKAHCDYIIHAASNAYPKAFELDPVGTMLQNFMGIKYLLDYATKHNARVLYISTGEVYGQSDGSDFNESYSGYVDITNPRSCYPSSKRASETLCASYVKQYGTNAVIVRPSHVYGLTATAADTRASTQFIRAGVEGRDIVMKSKGEQVRSYTYVADCAAAMLYVLQYGNKGEAYNISNKNSVVSIREMADIIADICNVKVRFEIPDEAEKASYNPVTRSVLSCDKLAELGFEGRYDMRMGLELTIKALKENV